VSVVKRPAPMLEPLLASFAHEHLPSRQRDVAAPYATAAEALVHAMPAGARRTDMLETLLEHRAAALIALDAPPAPPSAADRVADEVLP
jgi:hypothetical protein